MFEAAPSKHRRDWKSAGRGQQFLKRSPKRTAFAFARSGERVVASLHLNPIPRTGAGKGMEAKE